MNKQQESQVATAKRTIQQGIKCLKEVWAVSSREFNGYDYVAPDGSCWNVDRVEDKIVHLWTINGNGHTYYKAVNLYEFKAVWKGIGTN